MKRRIALGSFTLTLGLLLAFASMASAATKGTVTYDFAIAAGKEAKSVRLWTPYPLSEAAQKITDVKVSGNYSKS